MTYSSTTDPSLRTFVEVAADSQFPIQNLPYGVFTPNRGDLPHIGVAIGERILDLTVLETLDYFTHPAMREVRPFSSRTLNAFMALGPEAWRAARESISQLLTGENPSLKSDQTLQEQAFVRQREVSMQLPVAIGDYTDFYSSREHATNVGALFRGPDHALMPNWLHLPVAYHGRSSSVVVSGTEILRPAGQRKPGDGQPAFGPSQRLDFELEVGILIGPGNGLGRPIPVEGAREHVFGMVLVNDWSARDIQQWEYVPLGPFLGKNFATTISPWVVPMEALAPFACDAPVQEPEPLPYLRQHPRRTFDLTLEVVLETPDGDESDVLCRTNFRHLYWTIDQQIAHHTVNGCNLRPGDLLASGTISGSKPGSYGSLLELTRGGAEPLSISTGAARTFLEDGDTVVLRGWAQGDGYRIGFGEARGTVVPGMK